MQPHVPLTMAANRKPCLDPLDDRCTRKFGKTDGQGSWFFQSLLEEPAPELPWKGAGLQATPHPPLKEPHPLSPPWTASTWLLGQNPACGEGLVRGDDTGNPSA